MAAETDRLFLSNRKLFKSVRDNLTNSSLITKNIVQCKDDILYVWNGPDNGILTLNIKTSNPADDATSGYQTLLPTDPPSFDVDRLLVNDTASQLAVFGPRGVAVFDLPRRWGKDATFQGGKSVITCRCRLVDERYFACSPHLEIRQARWHPGSPTDTHLLVLTSDNTCRLYETSTGGGGGGGGGGGTGDLQQQQLRQVWQLGRTPSAGLSTATRMPFLASLGDTAVDFDFARPVSQPNHLTKFQPENAESARNLNDASTSVWPILVLRGNGDVYSVTSSLTSESPTKATVHGPLAMYPSDDDNYGVDACSILCLNCEPPVVVIATCSGTLYHCVLLDNEGDHYDDESNVNRSMSTSRYGSTYSLHSPEIALYVFESVELELGLMLDDNSDTYSCPIYLHHDISSKSRYFCSHDTGVHVMSLPLIPQLELFLNANDNEGDQFLPTMEPSSSAEYLICTRTSSSPVSPLLGLAFTQTPTMLVALLHNGEVVSLPLATIPMNVFNVASRWGEEEGETMTNEMSKEPFEEHIRKLLKHNLTQPILKFGPNADLTSKESMELVNRTTQVLREEYFLRHDKVRDEIERRVRSLQTLKKHQLRELECMQEEKVKLQGCAEQLAEKYEDIKDKQEQLTTRAEDLLRMLSQKQPTISAAEKKLGDEMKHIDVKVASFKKSLDQIKAKQAYHRTQKQQWVTSKEKRELYLAPTQMKTTKNILMQVTEDISDLKKLVGMTKKELGI